MSEPIALAPALRPLRESWFSLATCLAVSFVVFAPSLDVGFLSDDYGLIAAVHESGWFAGWNRDTGGFFRPLMVASLVVDHALFGLDARGFHGVNVALHGIDAWLVGRFVLVWTASSGRERTDLAWASSLLFAVLSGHTEPVVWIACRSDLLATGFGLVATILAMRGPRTRLSLALASAALVAALSSKESAAALPFVWGALELARSRSATRPTLRSALSTVGVGLCVVTVYLGVRAAVIGAALGGYGAARSLPTSVGEAAFNLVRLSVRPFLPTLYESARGTPVRWIVLVVTFTPIVAWLVHPRFRTSTTRVHTLGLALAGVATLAPVIGFRATVYGSENERFVYLASAFVVPFMVSVASDLAPPRVARAALGALIAIHAVVLVGAERRWVEAGRYVAAAVDAVSPLDAESTCVANLPDSVEGAHTLRNGFDVAVELATSRTRPPFVVGLFESRHLDDRRDLTITREALVLSPIDPATVFGEATDARDRCGARDEGDRLTIDLALVPPSVRRVVVFLHARRGGVRVVELAEVR